MRLDGPFDRPGWEKAMAGLGHRGSQQHPRLRHRDAYRSIRVRSGQFVLHGTLRKQSMELAMQATIEGNAERPSAISLGTKVPITLAMAALLALVAAGAMQVRAQAPVITKRQAKHLVTPTMPELAKK